MTNREAFNKFLRKRMEDKLSEWEEKPDDRLLFLMSKYPGTNIELNLSEQFLAFRHMQTGCALPVSKKDADWLNGEIDEHLKN